MTGSRSLVVGTFAAALLVLASCGSPSGSASELSLEELAGQALSPLAGVSTVDARQEAVTSDTSDRSDPDLWSLDIDVSMADDATTGQVASAAEVTRSFVEDHIGITGWIAHLRVGDIATVPGEDRTTLSPVQLDIYPEVRSSAATDARDAMALKDVRGVTSVAITNKVVSVQVGAAKDLVPVFDQVRALSIWMEGGILQTDTGQVRLADVPERITIAQAHAFLAASVDYPEADFAIESSGQAPEVYINKVTTDQGRAIAASFAKPALASKDADGFVLDFNIRSSDANQTVDIHGTFGESESD